MAAIFVAQATNTPITFSQELTILGVLLLTSKGAAGVTGSGFITLVATLSAIPTIPVEGLALILGIDRFMSEARAENHHELVAKTVAYIKETDSTLGGQLGKKSGARYQVYQRLSRHYELNKNGVFENQALKKAIAELYHYPLQEYAKEAIARHLKLGIDDESLSDLILCLREEDKFCQIEKAAESNQEPSVICSLGIV